MEEPQEETAAVEEQANPIITPMDGERFPLLEVPSQMCSTPVNPTDEEVIGRMDAILTELDEQAAGLAAVQIGYPKQIFLLRRDGENSVYINPVVLQKSSETSNRPEACLSLPGHAGMVRRPKSITLRYFDMDGGLHTETFTGFWAKAVSHEMDHLDGVLVSEHFQRAAEKQVPTTKFGMKRNEQQAKAQATRRRRNKAAKKARRSNR